MPISPTDSAFAAWYEREAPAIIAAVSGIVRERDLAEESVAEAFARAYARWGTVARMRSPEGWVVRVALNQAMGRFRKRTTEARHRAKEVVPHATLPELADPILWQRVGQLPDRMRTVVLLRYVADLPEAEIARVMRVSRGTVATQLSRARAQLRAALVQEPTNER